MGIAITAVLIVIFVVGMGQTVDLARVLREPGDRQKLLLRVLGFVLMSVWLHALPSMLMLNYLRHERILASELLSDDVVRTSTVGLFGLLQISVVIACSCIGLIATLLDDKKAKPWRLRNASTVCGLVMSLLFVAALSLQHGGLVYALYLGLIVASFSTYVHISLLNPLAVQIRLFALPFFLIGLISIWIFGERLATHSLVAEQLRDFRTGGSVAVVVERNEGEYVGRLVLLTSKDIYLNFHNDDLLAEPPATYMQKVFKNKCLIVLPREGSSLIFPERLRWPLPSGAINRAEAHCLRFNKFD